MSWLFGVGPKQPTQLPQMPSTSSGDGASADGGSIGKSGSDGGRMAYSFDSTALERAAKAAQDLEKSKYAKEALDLSKQQEHTRQLEYTTRIKELEAAMEQEKVEGKRVAEVERRKTLEEEAKHARARIDYQQALEKKRREEEMHMQKALQEEQLKKQEESIKRQEAMRKSTIEHELGLKHKYDMERVEAEAIARARAERENRDVIMEQLRAKEQERRTTILETIKTGGAVLGAGLQAFISDWNKVLAAAGGISMLALGVYTAKRTTGVTARYVEARMGKPSLVRETSRLTPIEVLKHPYRSYVHWRSARVTDPMQGVVLAPSLEERVRDIALTTKNTKKNQGLFRNVLFYGPPGTGKTMFAKRLAAHSGLDYAIMTGGDVAPMGKDGVTAIHKVFDWAQSSRRGLLLFVDEADAFLRKRSTEQISEDMRATLNAFLYRTGEQSNRFMLCIASNQPEQFDWAVNDRLDEMVEFSLPGLQERERMVLLYFQQYIAEQVGSTSRLKLGDFDWIAVCKQVAAQTDGLSGREISKLVVAWQASAYATEGGTLTLDMITAKTAEMMRQHEQKMRWLARERRILAAQEQDVTEKSLASKLRLVSEENMASASPSAPPAAATKQPETGAAPKPKSRDPTTKITQ